MGPGGLFPGGGGNAGGTAGTTVVTGGGTVVVPPGGTEPVVPGTPVAKTQIAQEPQIGINLCGCFERWGLHDGTTLSNAKIAFTGLSVQQIKQILQRLPSAFKASLEVTYDEESQA